MIPRLNTLSIPFQACFNTDSTRNSLPFDVDQTWSKECRYFFLSAVGSILIIGGLKLGVTARANHGLTRGGDFEIKSSRLAKNTQKTKIIRRKAIFKAKIF